MASEYPPLRWGQIDQKPHFATKGDTNAVRNEIKQLRHAVIWLGVSQVVWVVGGILYIAGVFA